MKKYILVTESGSDLPKEYVEKYNIHVVPMHVTLDGKTYDDGEISPKELFSHYGKTGQLPKTSGSNPEDFITMFDKINQEYPGCEIIYIAYSSVTTVSYNSAKIAAENYDNIHMVDSKNVSVGLGLIVVETAKFVENNPDKTPEEIVAFVEDLRERVRFVFLPQTLVYLKEGGRISNASYIGARLLKIYPTIDLQDGYLVAGKKYRGSFKIAYRRLVKDYFERFNIDLDTVKFIQVEGLSEEHKEAISHIVRDFGVKTLEWQSSGAVISTHGGEGAFGIVGIEK